MPTLLVREAIFRQLIAEIDTSKLTKGRPHEVRARMGHPAH